jgi:leucyl/phenylalanyl-tRNA--protein transferase
MYNKSEPTLNSDFLLVAYCNGYFPMSTRRVGGHIEWHSPDPRAIIPLDKFKTSRSLKQILRKQKFQFTIDAAFENVMRCCASREETWISEKIIDAYVKLHRENFAHSVEVWFEGRLVGGLYGVAIRGAFFGESMFSRMTDASKVALAHLIERLKERGFTLLDTQFMTEHLRTLGAIEISRTEYLALLAKALDVHARFV